MARKSSSHTSHEEAVSIIEKLVTENLGGTLEATAECNQCSEELTIDLVAGASSVSREKLMGTVRPDISVLDENGEPVRFIEIVDSHAPEGTVHEQALQNGTEVVEIHLRGRKRVHREKKKQSLGRVPDSQGEITGTRRWTARCRRPQHPLPQTQVHRVWHAATVENNNSQHKGLLELRSERKRRHGRQRRWWP